MENEGEQNALRRLAAVISERRRFGMKPGLEAIRRACAALDNPQDRLRGVVHVAGTNGKGAVCAILDAALRAAGRSTGRYTSPHLMTVNERFFLNGAPASDNILSAAATRLTAVPLPEDFTFFETLTAVAFQLYAEADPDHVILETGLGGRLDATNVCRPSLSVITRVGLDHCDWLGDTVEKIAAEKAGIVKPGVPVVLGCNAPSVRNVVAARAAELGAPFVYAPEAVDESEIPADFALAGGFNRENAVTALAALKTLLGATTRDYAAARRGFANVVWPGRFQRIGRFTVDGAHNPPAARALADTLDGCDRTLIAGFCGDKDVETVLRILAPRVRRGLAVRTTNPRSLTAEETAKRMAAAGIPAEAAPSLEAALAASRGETLVCGSLFLAGETLVKLGAFPWSAARLDPSERLRPA